MVTAVSMLMNAITSQLSLALLLPLFVGILIFSNLHDWGRFNNSVVLVADVMEATMSAMHISLILIPIGVRISLTVQIFVQLFLCLGWNLIFLALCRRLTTDPEFLVVSGLSTASVFTAQMMSALTVLRR